MRNKLPIFYSALLLTSVNLLLRFVSTSFQVYISGKLGAAGVGLLQLVMSVGGLAMTAGIAGVRTASMYLTAGELGRKQPGRVVWVLSGCFTYSILCSTSVALLLFRFAPQLAQNWIGDIRTVQALRTFAAFLPVSCLCGVMTGYFTAANRIGTLAAVEVAEQLCSMALTMLFLQFWAGDDPGKACQSVIWGSGFSSCFTLLCLIILRIRERIPRSPSIPVAGPLLRIAVPLAGADIAKAGINTTENLMVPKRLALHSGTEDSLAAFGTVCGMVFPILMLPASLLFGLAELLIPEMARCAAAGSRTRIQYLVRRSLRVAMLYGLIFCGLEFLLAVPLCQALYQSAQAGIYLQQFSLMIPMLYCDALTDAMTKGLGQQNACVRYNILTSAMDVALLFLLLPRWGMAGYLFSFLVTHLINFLLSLRRLLRITGIRIRPVVPLLAGAACVFSLVASASLPHPALSTGAYMLLLGSLLFLCRVLRLEDVLWLKSLLKKG